MSYVGNTNTTQAFTPAIDYFSGNGSTTAFTLSRPVASVAQVQVVVNNVAQNPSSAYTVSSNTITFTSAPSSGTNNIYVYYTSPITQVTTLTQDPVITGNLNFGSTGARITGDFTNATLANRVMFQNSVTNGASNVQALPNGTGTTAGFLAFATSDPANTSFAQIRASATFEVAVVSGITGTGTYLPMIFYTGGSERMRVDTSGNVLVTNPAGLGYGTGSGGTVTQATNKATGVTLNKPAGQITMNNAALAAGATVTFLLTNSFIATQDILAVSLGAGDASGTSYQTWISYQGGGAAYVNLKNTSGGSRSEAVIINFAIIKVATS